MICPFCGQETGYESEHQVSRDCSTVVAQPALPAEDKFYTNPGPEDEEGTFGPAFGLGHA